MNKYCFLLLITSLFSCYSNQHQLKLPELRIEGKEANQYILNRDTDYSIGHQDGCIIVSQMSMRLDKLNSDSIAGELYDSNTKKPLFFCDLVIALINSDTLRTTTDAEGKFSSHLDTSISSLSARYIGYKSIKINLTEYNY